MSEYPWTDRCQAFVPTLAKACEAVDVAKGIQSLGREIVERLPQIPLFREIFYRGGWYRLGGILEAGNHNNRVTHNLEEWTESALIERDGDLPHLLEDFADSDYIATRILGKTHYLAASTGDSVGDFLQLEIEELQEVTSHSLFDRDPPPETVDEFLSPRKQEKSTPVASPYYAFRRITHIGEMIEQMKSRHPTQPIIERLLSDWERSSAGQASAFYNHWVISVGEYLDRYKQRIYRAQLISALDGNLPTFLAKEGTQGLDLHFALQNFDRQAGYPFAWYFHLITTKAVPHWVARAAVDDTLSDYAYLPDKDLAVLKEWLHSPYVF